MIQTIHTFISKLIDYKQRKITNCNMHVSLISSQAIDSWWKAKHSAICIIMKIYWLLRCKYRHLVLKNIPVTTTQSDIMYIYFYNYPVSDECRYVTLFTGSKKTRVIPKQGLAKDN